MIRSSFLQFLLISVVILIMAGLGYAGWKFKGKKEMESEPILITLPTLEETDKPIEEKPEISEIDTSDWETYRNEEYGFEVKYPQDWILTSTKTLPPHALSITISKNRTTIAQPKFAISINPESWFYKPYLEPIFTEEIQIDYRQFTKMDFKANNDPALGCKDKGIKGFHLFVSSIEERKKNNVRIWGSTCENELYFMETLNKILSTFKFKA